MRVSPLGRVGDDGVCAGNDSTGGWAAGGRARGLAVETAPEGPGGPRRPPAWTAERTWQELMSRVHDGRRGRRGRMNARWDDAATANSERLLPNAHTEAPPNSTVL